MYEKIKTLARRNGMTIRQLEEAAGLGKNTLWYWDERSPSVDKVWKVAQVLNVTIDELVKP